MTFLQKGRLKDVLRQVPDGAAVVIDRRAAEYVDDDIEELLREFGVEAPARNISLEVQSHPAESRAAA